MMFGLMILTKSKLEKITETIRQTEYEIAYHDAMREIVDILRQSDNVYLEPVNIIAKNASVENSTFLGISGKAISVDAKKCLIKDNNIMYSDTGIEVVTDGH